LKHVDEKNWENAVPGCTVLNFLECAAGSLESRPTGPPAKIHGFSKGHPFRQKPTPSKNMRVGIKYLPQ